MAYQFQYTCLILILEKEENNRIMQKANIGQEKQDQNKISSSVKTKSEKHNYALYYLDTNKTHFKAHDTNIKYIKNYNFVNRPMENAEQCSMYNSIQKKNKKFKNMRFIIQKINEMGKNSTNFCLNKQKWPKQRIQINRWKQRDRNLENCKQGTQSKCSDNKCPDSPYLINNFVLSKRLMVTSLILSQHHNRDQPLYHKNKFNVRLKKGDRLKSSQITKTEKQLQQIEQIYHEKNKIQRYFQNNLSSNLYNYQLSQTRVKSDKKIETGLKDSLPLRSIKDKVKLKSKNSEISCITKLNKMKTAEGSQKRKKTEQSIQRMCKKTEKLSQR